MATGSPARPAPDLAGRVAVVTGASRGLGAELAVALAAAGAAVALAARDRDGLAATAARIAAAPGPEPLCVETDVGSPASVEELQAACAARLGQAAILVNAAGVFGPLAPFSATDPEEWVRTLLVNAAGPYLTCRAFVGGMRAAGFGRIVNVSSAAALLPPGPLDSAYASSKAALNRLTRHLAAELAGSGVSAVVIHPGSLRTAMWDDIRAQAGLLGEAGAPFAAWAERVEREPGDPLARAVELVLDLVDPARPARNGAFCWPEGSVPAPVESW